MAKGYTGKMVGIPIAVEHHADGSVTVCKEIADDIFNHKYIPKYIRDLFHQDTAFYFVQTKGESMKENN